MHDDLELLRRFARDRAEESFAELVQRHLNLVHSAALRQVRSPQLAEEVTQSVFTDLARDAGRLKPDTVLAAWLYQVTRRTAIDVVRREARRQLREQVAVEMNAMNSTSSDWAQVEPLLDDAMAALDDTDRTAVLLRYFENKSLRDVGAALGTSDGTAQKRVSRAVDRLREFFAQRGVTVGASGLVVVISANAVQAAPAGLAAAISTASLLAGAAIATTATVTTTQTLAMTTIQKTIYAVTLAAAAGMGIYEAQRASRLQRELHALPAQVAQVEQLRQERDAFAKRLSAAQREVEQLQRDAADIHRLRGEITGLRQQTNEIGKLQAENRKLTLVGTAPSPSPTTEEQERALWFGKLRDAKALTVALVTCAQRHNGQFPTNFDQASKFFDGALRSGLNPGDALRAETDLLQATNLFEIVFQGSWVELKNPSTVIVLRERQPQMRNGIWAKSYAFADGHSEIVRLPAEGFEAWEAQRMVPAPKSSP